MAHFRGRYITVLLSVAMHHCVVVPSDKWRQLSASRRQLAPDKPAPDDHGHGRQWMNSDRPVGQKQPGSA